MLAAACGYDDIHKLSRKDLRPLTLEASMITGLPLPGMSNIRAHSQKKK